MGIADLSGKANEMPEGNPWLTSLAITIQEEQ